MTQPQIVRLRGDAPALAWPADELSPLIDQCAELRRVQSPDSGRDWSRLVAINVVIARGMCWGVRASARLEVFA